MGILSKLCKKRGFKPCGPGINHNQFQTSYQGGAFECVTAEYDITDSLTMTGGIAVFQSGSYTGFEDINKNDLVFFDGCKH